MINMTLALIKSDACARGHADPILHRAQTAGLQVMKRAALHLERPVWETFYVEHLDKPHFEGLVRSVTGHAGIVAAILSGENAVARWRELLGPSDPIKAVPGTIRADFGTMLPDNAAHGSRSPESAAWEISILAPAITRALSRSQRSFYEGTRADVRSEDYLPSRQTGARHPLLER